VEGRLVTISVCHNGVILDVDRGLIAATDWEGKSGEEIVNDSTFEVREEG
jgi:hypothetical protein